MQITGMGHILGCILQPLTTLPFNLVSKPITGLEFELLFGIYGQIVRIWRKIISNRRNLKNM